MRTLLALLVLAAGLAAGAMAWGWYDYSRSGPLDAERTVLVEEGSGAQTISRELEDAGVIRHPLTFLAAVRLRDEHGRLQAGEYAFPARASVRSVIDRMVRGDTVVRRITVAEGLTSREALRLVEQAEGLTGPLPPAAEGSLLPDTYHFTRGDSRSKIVERMQRAMDAAVGRLWSERPAGSPLESAEDLVTLASIVEKETGIPAERPRVAAVFLNRLRKGMPLQSDPTVAYAIEREGTVLERPLTKADLAVESPYNTYGTSGLPPGPIANPGVAALEAVVHPAETEDLYFVADGSGGHAFARTLDEHNRNVRRWRDLQRSR